VSADGLAALRALVAADEDCARGLASVPDEACAEAVLRLAVERGLDVTPADLDAARAQAAYAWNLRWIA